MEEEAVSGMWKRACKDGARLVSSIVAMLVLVWVVHTGFKLATDATRDAGTHGSEDNYMMVVIFGVVTVVFGSIYFIVGLTIVAGLVLDLSTVQISVTMASMLMLTWAIYHGYKLAAEAPKGGVHHGLAFVVGFVAMGFGFVYFIIGIGIVAKSTLYLSSKLLQVIGCEICQGPDTDAYFAV